MSNELFRSDPEREAGSRTMNDLIVRGFASRQVYGTLARRAQAPDVSDASHANRERLTALYAERDDAMKAADADALAFVEHKIDRLFDDVRAARQGQPRDPETGQYLSFDGGVRGRKTRPLPGHQHESANALFRCAIERSRVERAEAEADPGHTIIANF